MQPYTVCEELAADGTYGVRGDPYADEAAARADAAASAAKGTFGWRGKVSAMLVLDAKGRAIARYPTRPPITHLPAGTAHGLERETVGDLIYRQHGGGRS